LYLARLRTAPSARRIEQNEAQIFEVFAGAALGLGWSLPKAIRCRLDDKTGKPVGINEGIGRHPIAGNSGGDLEMLQWTTISDGVRFGVIVHRTDAEREYAYDKKSHFGRLDAALDACRGQ
jgi:hypothetical protein